MFQHLATQHAARLMRFGLVGISGVLVNTGVLWSLVTLVGLHHLIAAAIASEISIVTNFMLNDRWTFADTQAEFSYLRRGAHYNMVALSGMVISLGVLAALTDLSGMQYLVANLIAIGAATMSNYLLNTRFTWSLPVRQPAMVELRVGE